MAEQAWQIAHREAFLATYRKGDEILPVEPGDPPLFTDPLPQLMPIFSAVAGAGVIYARVPDFRTGVPQWKKQIWFAGEPWYASGRNRVYWWLSFNEFRRRALLVLIVAPEVEVWKTVINDFSWVPPQHPWIDIFRVSSSDLVPALGASLNIHEVLGEDTHLVNGVDITYPQLTPDEANIAASYPALDVPVTIKPRQNQLLIEQDYGHWSVNIRLNTRGWAPEGFVHQVLPAAYDKDRLPYITVRVHHTDGVAIDVMRADALLQGVLARNEVITKLRVETVRYQAAASLPPQGTELSAGNEYTAYSSGYSNNARWWGQTIEAVLGFVPVLGVALDLGHLAYMASSGKTFWGDEVTAADMFVQGVFAMVGLVCDAEDAAKLVKISGTLMPGATIISINPGIVPSLRAAAVASCDPYVLHVIETLTAVERRELVDALVKYAGDGDLTNLLALFNKHVGDAFARAVIGGALPEGLVRNALAQIHPADLPGFLLLDAAAQQRILQLMSSAPGRAVLDALTQSLSEEFNLAFDAWRMSRAFNPSWTGFSVQLLASGFAKYGRRLGLRNAVQWAVRQGSNSRYYQELVRLMGPDYADLLRRTVAYWDMPASAIRQVAAIPQVPEAYWRLSDLASGVGHWMQIDHVIEQRFILNHPDLTGYPMDRDSFQCLLVPANEVVAQILKNNGIPYFYVHQMKTDLLRQLIPHGFEASYTLRQIFDAHLLVMKHQLGLPDFVVETILLDEFLELARYTKQYDLVALFRLRLGDTAAQIRRRLP
ncbi:MAG TPA: hypothetical protein VH601_08225 [Bryobacteraceae bacterium]|jgi:hypothetical protein